ncbi:MAG: hypothetical protein EXR93_09920 [Gemmatimonadetes bacterium]|nr:hypothetical protein [Gemmatimonadota bacterium]
MGSATACQPKARSIAPVDLVPIHADSIANWISEYRPRVPVRYDLKWQFLNDRGSTGGRAAIRIAPPDSLRFDVRGMFGKTGAAVVVGANGVWSKPENDFKDVLQSAPLFWAALGAPLRPPGGSATFGVAGAGRRAWRYAVGADTFDFVDRRNAAGHHLLAEMRRRGTIVGVTDATFNATGTRVASARIDFPAAETRFSFSVEAVDSLEKFDPGIWARP